MGTENERKYVLDDCEEEIAKLAKHRSDIFQGYLATSKGMSLRVRKTLNRKTQFYMTLKQKANGRCVEIEKKISERDFEDLWLVALNKLEKIRYDLYFVKRDKVSKWEIDFFKDHFQNTYFVQAEHEMPEGQLAPDYLPKIIQRHLLFEVPSTDDRFSSKKLANVKYAKQLYEQYLPNLI